MRDHPRRTGHSLRMQAGAGAPRPRPGNAGTDRAKVTTEDERGDQKDGRLAAEEAEEEQERQEQSGEESPA